MNSVPSRSRVAIWVVALLGITAIGAVWTVARASTAADATIASPTAAADPTTIMFLGDSITGSPGCWRADVWIALTDAGHAVEMVGTRTADECGGVTNAAGELWDPDNLAIGGITAVRMNNKLALEGVLEELDPAVVVALIGTNDVRGGASADEVFAQYDLLLSQLRDHHPNITLVIGRMLPIGPTDCPSCQPVVDEINARLGEWAAAHGTGASPIFVAQTDAGFDVVADTYDQLHPNESGRAKVADAMGAAIVEAIDMQDTGIGSLPRWVFAASLGPLLVTVAGVLIYFRRIRSALED